MDNTKFLPDDFELVGDKQNINIDEVLPSRPMWLYWQLSSHWFQDGTMLK